MTRRRSKREKVIPFIPNVFTTGNLLFGLLSVVTSMHILAASSSGGASSEWLFKKYWWASVFIVVAAFFDTMDGTLARLFKHESRFGLSYDSLSDLVSFGVAPVVLIYVWVLMEAEKLGLMVLLIYAVCTALRLARFNVQSGSVEKHEFSGLPSPWAAGLMISPVMLLSELQIFPDERMMWFYLFEAPFIGLLMVSSVKYVKFPKVDMGTPFNALVLVAISFATVATNPEIVFISVVYIYAIGGLAVYIYNYTRGKTKISDGVETTEGGS